MITHTYSDANMMLVIHDTGMTITRFNMESDGGAETMQLFIDEARSLLLMFEVAFAGLKVIEARHRPQLVQMPMTIDMNDAYPEDDDNKET